MIPPPQADLLKALRALRVPLSGVVGLLFALGRLAESLFFGEWAGLSPQILIRSLDALFWGTLAATAVWLVLTWAVRQEVRHRTAERQMLAELLRTNANLALLNEINQRIATSATLDEILDYAITLPARLLGVRTAALTIYSEDQQPFIARIVGCTSEQLLAVRAEVGFAAERLECVGPQVLLAPHATSHNVRGCLLLPLIEADQRHRNIERPLGWIEAYLEVGSTTHAIAASPAGVPVVATDTEQLLITVAGELAEALVGARRRAREVASVAALEQAITAERTRIAHDLHDGIAQSLAFMRMRVDLWNDWIEQDPERLREEFVRFKANLRTQIAELRQAIFALRPVEISQLGFEGALRRFVTDFAQQQGWQLELELSDLPHELPHAHELAAFRVVQEALNNAAKHARPQRIGVNLHLRDGGIEIVVSDDGVGFDLGQIEQTSGHLGLRQMRERAAALNGRVTIVAQPGAGSTVRVWLPLRGAV